MNRRIIVHIDDEPANYTYVVQDLQEVIYGWQEEDRGGAKCQLELGATGPEDFPSRSVLRWNFRGLEYEIVYWLVARAEQLRETTREEFVPPR